KGLLSHNCKSIFTNKFSRIKATKLDKCQLNLDCARSAFSIKMVISAVHIWIITAFSDVPTKDLICRSCFRSRKNISTIHLLRYSSPMVLADQVNWFVISSTTCLCSSFHTATRLSLLG